MGKLARTCNHPLFRYVSYGPWHECPMDVKHATVFVFERSSYIKPTPEQIKNYRRDSRIVEAHGGRMRDLEWEIAGKARVLSAKEERQIILAVIRDNPDAEVISHWNGKGFYSMSVGVDFKDA
jgi:hypothetical protein